MVCMCVSGSRGLNVLVAYGFGQGFYGRSFSSAPRSSVRTASDMPIFWSGAAGLPSSLQSDHLGFRV